MTCETCGEKPKKCGNCNKDFPRAVIEINNPETLVLLRKVVIPTSMGDEEQVPPTIGKYHNVILYYEANKHVYLYSSDGIPTLLEMDIPQELLDRIEDLEEEIDSSIGKAKVLTSADYNYPEIDPTSVALWLLPAGIYSNANGVSVMRNQGSTGTTKHYLYIIAPPCTEGGVEYVEILTVRPYAAAGGSLGFLQVVKSTGNLSLAHENLCSADIIDNLNSSLGIKVLSAKQGKVLNERIGDLTTLTTTARTSAVAAINELAGTINVISSQDWSALWQ